MGSAMIRRATRTTAILLGIVVLSAVVAVAGGFYLGLPYHTLDLSATFTQVPVAMAGATSVLAAALADMGFSPAELAEILDGFEEAGETVGETLSALPHVVPIPLIGGAFEIGLPLVIIDGVRFTGGFVSDSLIRGIADAAGTPIPQPLFEAIFDIDEVAFSGSASVDVEFSSWMLSTELIKRLDLFLFGMTLGGGFDVIRGHVTPVLDIDVPAQYQAALADALAALRIDEFAWSVFAAHATIGFEVGLPFLRLYGDVRFLLPLSHGESWWGVQVGGFAGLLGFAILF